MFSQGRSRPVGTDKEWTKEELEREAELQLSSRLRRSRKTLRERHAAADAAHLDRAPLFSAVIQWPGVMEKLAGIFQEAVRTAAKKRGGLDTSDDAFTDVHENKSRSPSHDSLADEGDDAAITCNTNRREVVEASPAVQRRGAVVPPRGTVGEEAFVDTMWGVVLCRMIATRGAQGSDSPVEPSLDNNADGRSSPGSPRSTAPSQSSLQRLRGGGRGPSFQPPPRLSIALQQVLTPDFERQHRSQFRRVFRLCDPQRVGGITWESLTSYLLDSTMFMKVQRETCLALPLWYQIKDHMDTSSHRPRQLKQMGNTSAMLILDGSGQLFHFCSDSLVTKAVDMRKGGCPEPQVLLIIDAEYIPPDNGICFSTVGADLYFFDMTNKNLERVILVDSAQVLVWHAPGRRLVTGDREGRITFWTLHRTNAIKRTKAPLLLSSHFVQKGVAIQSIVCGQERDVVVAACVNGVVQVFCTVTSASTSSSSQYAGGTPMRTFRCTSNILNCMAISEHQNVICCGTILFHPELWSIDHGGGNTPFTLEARIVPHVSPIVSVCCIRGNPQCISLDYAGVVKVWHMQLLTCMQTFVLHKQDPRSPWRGMLELNGYLFCTDRISIAAFHVVEDGAPIVERGRSGAGGAVGKSIEFAVAQRGATLGAVYVAEHGPSLVSLSGPTIAYWDTKTQRITAQLNPLPHNFTITSVCLDLLGHRCYVGDKGGSVWVLNIATAGVLEGFPSAHGSSPVKAVGFLRHAGVGISCSEDGVGVLLAPPSQQSSAASSLLQQRVQQLFHSMDTGICLVVDDPWQMVVTADRAHRVHLFSSADIGTSAKLHELGSVFIPDLLANPHTRASSFRKKSAASLLTDDTEFLPKGRCIVDIQHIPHARYLLLLVADNTSLGIVSLRDSLHRPPPYSASTDSSQLAVVLLAQWNIFTSFDGSISCILHTSLPEADRSSALERAMSNVKSEEEDAEAEEERAIHQQLLMQQDDGDTAAAHSQDDGDQTSQDGTGSRGRSPVQHQQGSNDNSSENGDAPATAIDGATDFERDMAELYASQRAKEQLVLDPQIILLKKIGRDDAAVSQQKSVLLDDQHRMHDIRCENSFNGDFSSSPAEEMEPDVDEDGQGIVLHFVVVAMESGSLVIFDITTAVKAVITSMSGMDQDAFHEACLFPLRLTRLNSPITCMCQIDSTTFCAGRADGLVDVLEIPSLGLIWSGLTSVANSPDYFPPTIDAQLYDGTLAKLQNTVVNAFAHRGANKLRSAAGSALFLASAARNNKSMVGSPKRSNTAVGFSASPKAQSTTSSIHSFVGHSERTTFKGSARLVDLPLPEDEFTHGTENTSSTSTTPRSTTKGGLAHPRLLRAASKHQQSLDDTHPSHPLPPDESVWILGQLSTLCGDRSFLKHIGASTTHDTNDASTPQKRGERLLRTTPSGVMVFQGKDPFAECTPVDVLGNNGAHNAAAPVADHTDQRKSQRQKNQEQFSVQNPVNLKAFDDLGVDRPSSSRSFTRDLTADALRRIVPEPMPRASVLRPLSSTSMLSHIAVSSIPSRASTPGASRVGFSTRPRPQSTQPARLDTSAYRHGQLTDIPSRLQRTIANRLGPRSGATFRRLEAVELPPWLPR